MEELELLRRARECRFFQAALLEFGFELPADDEELDRLVGKAVQTRDNEAFVRILFAALGTGRRVDARHLEEGSSLFEDPAQLIAASLHLSGDVPRALIRAVEQEHMGEERSAVALLMAGLKCKDSGATVVPPELIVQARLQARRAGDNPLVYLSLAALSKILQDDGLSTLLDSGTMSPAPDHVIDSYVLSLVGPVEKSVLPIIPERAAPNVLSGYTVRRAAPRIGRNDPCPCGSGRKYKKCCLEKDQKRLQHSSSVEGLTLEELQEQRERFLTRDQLLDMRSYELVRIDPSKVEAHLLPVLITQLHLFKELESAVQLLERTGLPEELCGHWVDCVYEVASLRRKDLLERLLKLRSGSRCTQEDLPLAARLLLADESAALPLIEEAALAGLREDKSQSNIELAFALLDSPWPALGLLVSRGVAASSPPIDAGVLFEAILETRDKLRLSPDDPLEDLLDWQFQESIELHRDSAALQDAQDRLEAKNRELTQIRSRLSHVQAELETKEREAKQRPVVELRPAPARPPATDGAAVDELRQRVASLKEELKERHDERNQLRRDLNATLEKLESLRQKEASKSEQEEERFESALVEEVEPLEAQPVRIPEFSARFLESLDDSASTAVRQTMVLIGRLAAGERGSFMGIRRLRADRDIFRQRVGSDYRLLFRLDSRSIHLLALIPRRDLERTIRSFTAT